MIDDDEVFLSAYKKVLQKEYNVFTALNTTRGFRLIQDIKPHILLLDISIRNEREGLEVLPLIKQKFKDLSVIMVTNWDSFSMSEEAVRKGADYFFIKSRDLEELKFYIKDILQFKQQSESETFPIAQSQAMKEVLRMARAVARTDMPVTIYGETGVGKEVIARYIHGHSHRRHHIFKAVNSAAIPDTLLESELFGFEKGAFTGAYKIKKGVIEQASGGTLFLDEIKDLSPRGQASLLRVLEQQELEHLGSVSSIQIDIRIVAASQAFLAERVEAGKFRSDLFFRLAGTEIYIPPLRERVEDLLALIHYFLRILGEKNRMKSEKRLTQSALLMLKNYHWPGNVRELYHTLENAVLFSKSKEIKASEIRLKYKQSPSIQLNYELARQAAWEKFEKEFLENALVKHEGNITKTAKAIGLSRQSLQKKIKQYGLDVNGTV